MNLMRQDAGVYRQMEIEGFPSATLDAGTQSMSVGKAPGATGHNEPAAMLHARANQKVPDVM